MFVVVWCLVLWLVFLCLVLLGDGPNPEKGLFLCSLQHFGGNLNTRDLKARGSVEYLKESSHEKSCTYFYSGGIFDQKRMKYLISAIHLFF